MMEGKHIVVTGGASGIGRATVLRAANAGARVYIGDINEAGGREVAASTVGNGGSIEYVKLDLTSSASIEAFAEAVHARADGAVDGLVNAAGWDKVQPFLQNDPSIWERVMAINLMGPISLTYRIAARMSEARRGRIVNIASDAGRVGSSGETVYAAAKGGLIAFTKSLARELARQQINVNVVCPGPTDTPLFHDQVDEKTKDALVRAIPFRRLARPEEIADAVLFFLADGSGYVTGQTLSVSGGLTMAG